VIFSITNRLYRGGEVKREKTSPCFEVALVPVHFDEFSCSIINVDHSIMRAAVVFRVSDCVRQ
jgi:hypothetical protein